VLIVCAWCERDGTPSLLAVRATGHDGLISHGICTTHANTFTKALRLKAGRLPASKHAPRTENPRKRSIPPNQLSLYPASNFDASG